MEGDGEIEWTDMTEVLREAAKELGEGQMLHAESFNLGDSMSALEMMDPKMDAGLLNPDVVPAEECFEKGLIPLNPDTETCVALIDRISALEMTWLRGSAIVQTIFTSIHCHRPAEIENDTLRIYCQAMLKCCDMTKRVVSKASVYEEEDFSTNIGGYSLCEELTDEEVTAALTAQEEAVGQRAKACKQRKTAKEAGGEEEVGAGDTAEEQWVDALLARVRLRRAYGAALQHLSKGYKGVKAARKSIAWAQQQLVIVASSRGYDASRIGKHSVQPELNMKMMAPSPPRAVRILSVPDSLRELARLLRHLDCLCLRIVHVTNLNQLHHFLSTYTSSTPAPGVLPRSFLRMLLSPDNKAEQIAGKEAMSVWVRESMEQYLIPADALARPEAATFVQRCAKVLFNYCLTLTYNAGRQRRRMVHAMEEWGQVQIQAERMDQHAFLVHDENGRGALVSASGAFFSGWLLDHLMEMVTRYLELGFQLRLYAGFEYSMIYWYWDYLLGVRINCQPTVFFQNSRAYQEQQLKKDKSAANAKNNKKKGKADKGSDKAKKLEPSNEQLALEARQALSDASGIPLPDTDSAVGERGDRAQQRMAMCRGMFRLVAGLDRQGIYFVDPLSAASLPLRFHRRFSPVMRLEQPSGLTYEHYLDSTDSSPYEAADLYAAAAESFAEGKAHCDRLAHRLRDKSAAAAAAPAGPDAAAAVLELDDLEAARSLLRVALHNQHLAQALQARALLPQHPPADPASLPPLPPLPEAPRPDDPALSLFPSEDAEAGPSALSSVLPCDTPQVSMSSFIAFDFSACTTFPCVVVNT